MNIPDYAVVVRENGEAVMRLRAIVGREYRQTPVFTGRMTCLVLSPFRHVPPGIAANDKFPLVRKHPSCVASQQMTLLDLRTDSAVNPASIDHVHPRSLRGAGRGGGALPGAPGRARAGTERLDLSTGLRRRLNAASVQCFETDPEGVMERVVNKAASHEEARRWDIEQQVSMSPEQRMRAARALKDRAFPSDAEDVRAWHRSA